MGDNVTSWFSLIDLDKKAKVSETSLFPLDYNAHVFPLDVDGDGKVELCRNTSSGIDIYSFSSAQNRFVKIKGNEKLGASSRIKSAIFGDLMMVRWIYYYLLNIRLTSHLPKGHFLFGLQHIALFVRGKNLF